MTEKSSKDRRLEMFGCETRNSLKMEAFLRAPIYGLFDGERKSAENVPRLPLRSSSGM